MARNDHGLLTSQEMALAFSRMAGAVAESAVAFQGLVGPLRASRDVMERMGLLLAELAAYEEDRRRSRRMAVEAALGSVVFSLVCVVPLAALGPYGPPLALLWVSVAFLSHGWREPTTDLEDVEVPEWGVRLRVKSMSEVDRVRLLEDH